VCLIRFLFLILIFFHLSKGVIFQVVTEEVVSIVIPTNTAPQHLIDKSLGPVDTHDDTVLVVSITQ
jgi:hypothetical protein